LDQEFVKSATSESGVALLDFLPVLGKAEAVVMGEGVPLPLRIRFDELDKANGLPNGQSAHFSEVWSQRAAGFEELEHIVANWRAQRRLDSGAADAEDEPLMEAELPPPPSPPPPSRAAYQTLPPLPSNGLAPRTAPPATVPPPPPPAPKPATPGLTLRPGSLLNSIRKNP
jgi:hypothetical protein